MMMQIFRSFTKNFLKIPSPILYAVWNCSKLLIDGKLLALPMAVEESSVVAAASKAAKFWIDKGGFKTTIINTEKSWDIPTLFLM